MTRSLLTFVLIFLGAVAMAQPPEFTTPSSPDCGDFPNSMRYRTFVGEVGSGITATTGDWVAAFDADDFVVGVAELGVGSGFGCTNLPFFDLIVYADDDLSQLPNGLCNAPPLYGLNDGDLYTMVLWDASSGLFYEIGTPITYQGGAQAGFPPSGGDCVNDLLTFPNQIDPPKNVLPVEFAHFRGQYNGNQVALSWMTYTETANEFFSIERSSDGVSFYAIGQIAGAGTSTEVLDYSFLDKEPEQGINYYRLRQTDFDGSSSISDIVIIEVDGLSEASARLTPNPASGSFVLSLNSGWKADQVDAQVFDGAGRSVMSWAQATGSSQSISLGKLPAGLYQVRLQSADQVKTQRLVVR
ncbi:MAG: T9SS type A sorting domain-containing protein [Bacteroidota bacterium]